MKKILFAVVAMLMCAACGGDRLPMENTKWNLSELQGVTNEAFADGDTFWFALDGEGIVGVGACNRFFGGYQLSDKEFRVGGMGMTRMACPNMDLEDSFVRIFEAVDGYDIDGSVLTLKKGREVLAKFNGEVVIPGSEEPQSEDEVAPTATPAPEQPSGMAE